MASITDYFGGTSTAGTDTGDWSPRPSSNAGLLNDIGTGLSIGGDILGGFSTYQADQAKAQGLRAESRAYNLAAGYAAGDVQLAEESKMIREYQTQRKVSEVEGAQVAQAGSAGFASGGSGLSLLKESASQGALATGLVNVQGEQIAQNYRAQQAADIGLSSQSANAAKAADTSGIEGFLGGILKGGAAAIPLLL